FGDLEGLAGNLGNGSRIDQILIADQSLELPLVHLRNDHLAEASKKIAKVARKRPDVAVMDMGDIEAAGAGTPDRLVDRPEGRAPADDHQARARITEADILERRGLCDSIHFLGTKIGHRLV